MTIAAGRDQGGARFATVWAVVLASLLLTLCDDRRQRRSDAAPQTGPGRGAVSPEDIPASGWVEIARRVWEEIGKDRIVAVAAGVSFYLLLAIVPAIAAAVSIYGIFADPAHIGEGFGGLSGLLPAGAVDIAKSQTQRIAAQGGGKLGFGFIIGLAVSLWSANAGMKAIFDALNVAFEEQEKRSFFWLNAQSLLFTVAAILLLFGGATLAALLPLVLQTLGFGPLTQTLVNMGRWPVLFGLMAAALAVLYRYGPSRAEAQWRWITPGSLFAAAA